jgi:hypothetical protein
MKCPVCDGACRFSEDMGEGTILYDICSYCKDSGMVSVGKLISYHVWQNLPDWAWDLVSWIRGEK